MRILLIMSTISTVVETTGSLYRSGRYESPTFLGWAYIHGTPWKHEVLTESFNSAIAGYTGKVGTISTLTGESGGGRGSYNEVQHSRKRYDAPLVAVENIHESTVFGKKMTITSYGSMSCGPSNLDFAITRGSFPNSESSHVQRTVNKMQFNVQDAGFNLPVFLGELREMKTILEGIGKHLDPIRGWDYTSSHLKELIKAHRGRPVASTVAAIANANLFNNFAVQPFLADLNGMLGSYKHMLRQIDRLSSIKPVVVRSITNEYLNSDEFDATGSPPYNVHGFRTQTIGRRKVVAWARIQYNWGALIKPPGKVETLLDSVGVDQPLTVAWELTPWSFLVDYFYNIGAFLKQFDGELVKVPFTVLQDGYSVKTEKTACCTVYVDNGQYNNLWRNKKQTFVQGSLHDTVYKRVRGPLPGGLAYPELKMPSLKQAGNIVSLVLSSVLRPW